MKASSGFDALMDDDENDDDEEESDDEKETKKKKVRPTARGTVTLDPYP